MQTNTQDFSKIIYIDHYGNCMTGMRAAALGSDAILQVAGQTLHRAETFEDAKPHEAFWYENSVGLAEIAVNQGSAAHTLGLQVGTAITMPK